MKNVLVKLEPGLVDQYAQGTERDGAREAKQLKQELARTMRMVVEQAEANTKYLVDFERRVSAFADRDDALQRGHTSKGGTQMQRLDESSRKVADFPRTPRVAKAAPKVAAKAKPPPSKSTPLTSESRRYAPTEQPSQPVV